MAPCNFKEVMEHLKVILSITNKIHYQLVPYRL